MHWRNTIERYGFIGQSLHWLVVGGIIASYLLAEAAEDDEQGGLMGIHRSLGIAIFALALLRVAWRLVDRTPAWPATMAFWERAAAGAAHLLLYALLFALPLTGWLVSGAQGHSVSFFGLFELPPLQPGADAEALEDVHEALFNVLVALAALHAAAALKHQFWDRDGVLARMLPGRNRGAGAAR
jgi:cytochrome b561